MNACIDPQFTSIRERVREAYTWGNPDRPPLLLYPSGTSQGGMAQLPFLEGLNHPEHVLIQQLMQAEFVRDVESDNIPLVIPVPTSAVLVASMFGCEVVETDCAWAKPLEQSLEEIAKSVSIPDFSAGLMPRYIRSIRYVCAHAPDWVHVTTPTLHGPLETVMYMLEPEQLYLGMYEHPELVEHIMDVVTDATIAVIRMFKEMVEDPDEEMVSHKGFYMPALRIASDSVVNLSPEFIERFFTPYMTKIADAFNTTIHLHFCSIETNPVLHVPAALSRSRAIRGVNSQKHVWTGITDPAELSDYLNTLPGKICVSFEDAAAPTDDLSEFTHWAKALATRWADPVGVLIKAPVLSVEHGREIYKTWRHEW